MEKAAGNRESGRGALPLVDRGCTRGGLSGAEIERIGKGGGRWFGVIGKKGEKGVWRLLTISSLFFCFFQTLLYFAGAKKEPPVETEGVKRLLAI